MSKPVAAYAPIILARTLGGFHNVCSVAYGAVGDGSTDDTQAVRNAIAAAASDGAGGVVFFPATDASYLVSGSLAIPNGVQLLGCGDFSPLQWGGAAHTPVLDLTGSSVGRISNLSLRGIDGGPGSRTGYGILFSGTFRWMLDNVTLTGFERGIDFEASSGDNNLHHVGIYNSDTGLLCNSVANWLYGCLFDSCTTGITSTSSGNGGLYMYGGTMSGGHPNPANVHIDYQIAQGSMLVFEGVHMETAQVADVRLGNGTGTGPTGTLLRGCFFSAPGGGAHNVLLQNGGHMTEVTGCTFGAPGDIIIGSAHSRCRIIGNVAQTPPLTVTDGSGSAFILHPDGNPPAFDITGLDLAGGQAAVPLGMWTHATTPGAGINFKTYKADGVTYQTAAYVETGYDQPNLVCPFGLHVQNGGGALAAIDGYIRLGNVGALPAASSTYRDQLICVNGGAGVADHLYVCLKNAADAYAWVQIA